MIVFWILAALLGAAAAVLVLFRAARATQPPAEPAELAVYRRQLAEIEDLADRGLIGADEHRIARAEAARRLLGAAEQASPPSTTLTQAGRKAVGLSVAAAILLALAAYVATGSPSLSDQPYARRLAGWTQADPSTLTPPELVAVLEKAAKDRPRDPVPMLYLARAQAAAGQDTRVLITLRDAVRRAPGRADVWTALGQGEVAAAKGEVNAAALAAFQRAARLDPAALAPKYFLARAAIAHGDTQGGLGVWRSIAASLPANDENRSVLKAEIAQVERTGRLETAEPAPAVQAQGDQRAFISSMVDSLAARLKSQPDDPQGWARLIRSYRVLGDEPRRSRAAAEARRLFAGRPDALRLIDAEDKPRT